ncbi:MAG: phosphoribosylglycinamide formyltransferase [Gammaproteobacteria bacterium]|jgi:phosphoribosylglycinamide formyltransferase-1
MKKLIVLISGSGSNLEAISKACSEGIINGVIASVISNNPNAYGLERAKKNNLSYKVINHKKFENREKFDEELSSYISSIEPDLIILAGFMRILGKKLSDKYFGKIINIHPSLLPKYPGLDTHEQVLKNNDSFHGISIHYVSSELDAGPLIAQGKFQIKNNLSEDELKEKIHKIEHILYPKIIKEICDDRIHLDGNKVIFKNLKSSNNIIYENYDL